ncbi:MAG: flagellar hook protein FliD [Arcobacter sp.]|nr:MAG: flagellar hook protein FliD [Arcobacter sp.]
MAEGVLGLGSGQAASLNNELIDKLKSAERVAKVEPLETAIEEITKEGGESEKIAEIIVKANELLDSIKSFDLYVSGGVSAFDQKSANVSGTSATFDAADETKLNIGTTNVTITTLAKRDVFQSSAVDATVKDTALGAESLVIALAGTDGLYSNSYTFDTTDKTYSQLADEINLNSDLTASVEQVGDDSYRLVIKSAESGTANALQITGTASQTLGYTSDGTTEIVGANIQEATNLAATVNGIAYDVSSNVITVDGGLKITAVEEGDSTISVQKDSTVITPALENFAMKYNELVALIDTEIYSADSTIEDKSTLRTMMEGIKEKLFGSYGADDSLSLFSIGFELDKSGLLTIDSARLSEVVENNLDDLKSLFLGVAEDEGLGTQLKTYLDDLDSFSGVLTKYQENMVSRKESLELEKEKAIEALDNKYSQLSQQFAAYGTIINQFEAQFSGLSLMIEQSTAG